MGASAQATESPPPSPRSTAIAYGQHLSSVDTVVGDGCVASVLRFEVHAGRAAVIQAGDGAAVSRLYDATELSLEALAARGHRADDRSQRASPSRPR